MKRKLQVFVSSTYADLMPERQASVSAILKAGHIPAGMELFTAGDRSQMETIKQWIDESDVYMLILGGRYGSVEPSSAVSYTELEYDYAIQQKKPLFAVVVTEGSLESRVKTGGIAFIERDNPKELQLFRQKVLSNISSFFEDPKDIKLCVHETLADFAGNRTMKGWVSANEVVDTTPLFEEITKLSDENRQLKSAIEDLEKNGSEKPKPSAEPFGELEDVLRAIEVKLPAKVTGGAEEKTLSLLTLFFAAKETFVNGITNKMGMSEADQFFYFNLSPKLQVHGLMENEKVPGVQYRRYAITKLGSEFLAHLERRSVLKKKSAKPNDFQAAAQAPNVEPTKAKSRARRRRRLPLPS